MSLRYATVVVVSAGGASVPAGGITHAGNVRTAIANSITNGIDQSATAGVFRLFTVDDIAIVSIVGDKPFFESAIAGEIQMSGLPRIESTAGGIAYYFTLADGDLTHHITGTVSGIGGGGDIELSTTTITGGKLFELRGLTYTAPL